MENTNHTTTNGTWINEGETAEQADAREARYQAKRAKMTATRRRNAARALPVAPRPWVANQLRRTAPR